MAHQIVENDEIRVAIDAESMSVDVALKPG